MEITHAFFVQKSDLPILDENKSPKSNSGRKKRVIFNVIFARTPLSRPLDEKIKRNGQFRRKFEQSVHRKKGPTLPKPKMWSTFHSGIQVADLWVTKSGCGQVERSSSCPRPGAGYPRVNSAPDHPERAALAAGPFTRPGRPAIWRARPVGGLPEPGGGEGLRSSSKSPVFIFSSS